MPKDIRSFFKLQGGMKNKEKHTEVTKKPATRVISDDEEIIPESPDAQGPAKNKKSRKRRVINDSSDEEETSKTNVKQIKRNHASKLPTKQAKPGLKEVSAVDMFGSAPIKRTPVPKKSEKDKNTLESEITIHSDDELEKTILQLDESRTDGLGEITEISVKNAADESSKSFESDIKSIGLASKSNGESTGNTESKQTGDILKYKIPKKSTSSEEKEIAHRKSSPQKHEEVISNKSSTQKYKEVAPSKSSPYKDREVASSKPSPKKHKEVASSTSSPHKYQELESPNRDKKNKTPDKTQNSRNNEKHTKKNEHPSKENGHHFRTQKDSPNGDSQKNDKKRDFSEFIELDCGNGSQHEEEPSSKTKRRKFDQSLNESVVSDEERYEKKRHAASLYQKYLNRSGPKNLGAKEIPEGAPNCLQNLSFVLTGVLGSFERDEIVEVIQKYGGTVKSGVSKKVTHVLAGDDAGPAKLAKAEELGLTILNEDQFLDLIRQQSDATKKITPKKEGADKKVKKEKDEAKSTPEEKLRTKGASSFYKNGKDDVKPVVSVESVAGSSNGYSSVSTLTSQQSQYSSETKSSITSSSSLGSVSGADTSSLMWVDKYKPRTVKQIIGQNGDASVAKKLMHWLSNWYANRKKKLEKPSPWAKKDDGGYFKCALLSGPPGIGKTTTVSLVCQELGFDTVEFNASDTRSKSLIRDQISELLTTTSLAGFAAGGGKRAVTKKHVLVMDEVDGMAGNEDRGGMQELISLIKLTSVPIVCMCNDRQSAKIRSLVNYCYDLRFTRPRVDQIKSAMMSVCFKEGIKIAPNVLTQLIVSAGQDVRQTLNLLSLYSAGGNNITVKKDVKLGPWEVVRKVFSEEEQKSMSIHDKCDLFFYDYSIGPLFVQENYLQVTPHCPKDQVLKRISRAADSIGLGDLVEAKIRGAGAWNLLPVQAIVSMVIPGAALRGHVSGQIQFPSWLGKNSRAVKMQRLAQEIHAHTRLSTSGSKSSIFLDYATHLRDAIVQPLIRDHMDGVQRSLQVLQEYRLLREDLDSLGELALWPGKRDPFTLVESKVKAALTRAYNKESATLPYAQASVKKNRSGAGASSEDILPLAEGEEEDLEDAQSDSDPENDAMIKKKNKSAKAKTTNKEPEDKPEGKKGGKGKKTKK